ncbi:hypothetical protein GNT65_14945 [Shewanella sp. JBTF-M18]|uniref:Uncharacterized protein n=1 Tax=Shewanella insulae TaxID=2681496 RepID=A0A6L7I3P0_9GAMM|nr:hypothetical protein [Shewanella insulae]MXR69958.1 hypothetical protein [Shewanella insulae]
MKWLVLGNGVKDVDICCLSNNTNIIVFNEGFSELVGVCRIQNPKISGLSSSFNIEGLQPFDGFEALFNSLYSLLQTDLNNVPSSGTVLLATLAANNIQARVVGMNLLPSIARQTTLRTHIPNPCHFHNWLGERRYALIHKFGQQFDWKALRLNKPLLGTLNVPDPFSLLKALATTPNDIALAKLISNISADCWLNSSSIESLQQAEGYFYLRRDQQRTSNWWLYHNQASKYLADTHIKLAWCQQSLLLGT